MSKMSFLQKLEVLIEVALSSYWLLIAIGFFVAIGVVLITNSHKNKKRNKIIYIVLTLVFSIFLLIAYHQSLNQVFEYLVDNLFVILLFPNYAFYFLEIVITNIIIWFSLFHSKTSELIKRLNVVVYLIMNYILILVLSVINTEQLDIFTVSSLYTNKKATALMELSSLLFVIWIIFLVLYKGILSYIRKDSEVSTNKVLVKKEVKKLPNNFLPSKIPTYIKGNKKAKTEIYEEEEKRLIEDSLTLEDYKQILKLLNEKKEKKTKTTERHQMNNIDQQIVDVEKLKIEEMKRREREREEERYTELDRLFRSMK